MSQLVKLKRTAVEGKVPNTSNLELGELAINTYDGRIFFEKDNGTPSIQQVVTTNAQTTGSLYIVGDVTASFFVGNGSQLTNLPNPDVSQVATVTSSFDNLASIVVTHNFGSKNVFISVYDTTDSQIIPQSVVLTNNNTVTVGLSANHSGYVVVGKGGHIVSGTLVQEVSEVATITASFDNQSSINVTHNFESRNIIVSIYDSNYSQLIPQTLTLTDENSVDIVLSGNHSGHVVVAKGGHLVSGSIITEADFTELTNIPSGLVSGSSQLTSSYDSRYTLSGSVSAVPSGTISGSSQLTASVLATTGSNSFVGNQSINGNVYLTGSLIPSGNFVYDLGSDTNAFGDLFISTGSIRFTNPDGTEQGRITVDASSGDIKMLKTFGLSTEEKASIKQGNINSNFLSAVSASNIFAAGKIAAADMISGQSIVAASITGSTNFNTIVNKPTLVSASTQVEFNVINNTPLSQSATNVTISKSLVPSTSTIDLGTAEKPFRDLYLSSASLYIDGQQVISSNTSELVITTDVGQSIKLLETGPDDIILQTDTGNIELKGTVELLSGKKIIDSGGTQILFGNSIGISGSISLNGTVDGVDVSELKSDFDSFQSKTLVSGSAQVVGILTSLNTYTSSNDTTNTTQNSRLTSLETKSGSVDSSISNINSFTSSNANTALNDYTSSLKTALSVSGQNVTVNGNFTVSGTQTIVDSTTVQIGDNIIELNGSGAVNGGLLVRDNTILNTISGSLLWDSTNDYWKAGALGFESKLLLANGDNVVSSSAQVVGILTSLNSYTSSNDTTNTAQNNRLTSLETKTGSLDTTNTTQNSRLTSIESATGSYETQGRGIVSGSSQVISILSSLNTYTGSNDSTNTTQNSRLTSIESATGSYETKGRGIVSGSSQVSYTGLSSIPSGIVSGSSQITLSSTTGYGSVINQAVLTSSSPTFNIVNATAFSDGYITHSLAQINRSGGFVELQYSSGGGVKMFGAGATPITFATTGGATFSGTVTSTGFILGNGQFLRGTRTSGGLVINLLGIESGTDRTMMTITGDYVIQNGSNTALLTMTTTGNSTFAGNVLPSSNNTLDLGSPSFGWRNIYTNDLHLSNEGKPEGNDVDGTTGNWTIQEGAEHLYIINNKTGKKFKFSLEEIQ